MTKISDRKEAYKYILDVEAGFKDEINLTAELFNDFCLVGYIKQGMDGSWRERWQITNFGKSQIKSYLKFFDQGQKLDDALRTLGIA